MEALTHALARLNAEASRSLPNPAKIRALQTSVEAQRALLARADSLEADRRISELAEALGDIAAYQKTVNHLANEMKSLVSEAARKEEELELLRSKVSNYRHIVEGVQREATEKERADAEKIAADVAEKKRLVAAQEISALEAQVAEIDQRNAMEYSRPGGPIAIGREQTELRIEHERKTRQRLRVLRGEITQKDADREDAHVQARKMSEQQRAAHDAEELKEWARNFNN